MNKIGILAAFLLVCLFSFSQDQITWLTWEEAVQQNAKNPKKIFVDVYTDWCGWCKKMDKEIFTDKEVAKYMNEEFYCVKLNAEQKESIKYNGKEFKYVQAGNRGYNALALALLNNRPSFPSFIVLSLQEQVVKRLIGYQQKSQLLSQLKSIQ